MAAEADAETRVRVEVKVDVRDWDVEILTDVLNKVNAALNGLKRERVGSEEDTKEKAERSMADVEAEERAIEERQRGQMLRQGLRMIPRKRRRR